MIMIIDNSMLIIFLTTPYINAWSVSRRLSVVDLHAHKFLITQVEIKCQN